jgi:signal transduction histidine kinase
MSWRDRVGGVERAVCAPQDDDETRLRKVLLVLAFAGIVPAGIVWALIYAAYGEPVAGVFPAIYAVGTAVDLALLVRRRGHYETFRRLQQFGLLLLPFALQVALGGFVDGSAVIIWSFIPALLALLFGTIDAARWWFVAFAGLVLLAAVLAPGVEHENDLPNGAILAFFVLNVAVVTGIAWLTLYSFMRDRERLRQLQRSYLDQELVVRQSQKLASLGTLAAGIAHELNNPAAAVIRGAGRLGVVVDALQQAWLDEIAATSEEAGRQARHAWDVLKERAGRVHTISLVERADREEELASWLDERDAPVPYELAATLVENGVTVEELAALTEGQGLDQQAGFARRLAAVAGTERLLAELAEGAERISTIVQSMRSYTYLDQGPVQSVDVTEGLESSLVLLQHRLKHGIRVEREYEPGLPRVEGHGGELNQVWTNLMGNALDTMGDEEGTLRLRALSRDGHVVVEVEDDGPGMSPETAARVFDPFFTTKPVGSGTGLGLSISHTVVTSRHGGTITVDSEPGRTTFRVALPLPQTSAM